ncbi:MAG TPA: EpsG family protein [Niabella sp.]|nr:EpsG family protein [Niabella sp.]
MNKTSLSNKRLNYPEMAYHVFIFLVAVGYAYVLASQPVDGFVDRVNYLVYAGESSAIFDRYLSQGVTTLIFNEPIWLLHNTLLSLFLAPEGVVAATIFLASYITAYLILKFSPAHFILLVLYLLLPQVLKNNIIHLRQGLAIAVFLLGWFSSRPNVRYFCFFLACFIHSSFIIILFLYALNEFFVRFRYGSDLRAVIVACIGLLAGVFGIWVAGVLGARQADQYADGAVAVSGLGFVFWVTIAGIFLRQGKFFLRNNSLQFSIIVFYLSTYFFLPVAARVFESAILLVLLSALQLTSYRRYTFIGLFFCYFLIQWSSRILLPGFGWGVENYL